MVRILTALREVAHLYRGFLFDLACLRGEGVSAGSSAYSEHLPRAEPLRCIRELVARGKFVAVVQGTPLRASSVSALAVRSGAPQGLATWTSGEFVRDRLRLRGREPLSVAGPLGELLGTEGSDLKPLHVMELGPLVARPRRWAEAAVRGDPPLTGLGGTVLKRVDGVEDADICYWDAPPGDEPGVFVDAALELCAERRVPLLHAARSVAAAKAVAASAHRNSAEAAALRLQRLGGRCLSVGKLEGCFAGLGWEGELNPREVLLVSPDLGDVCEAAEHGVDSMLVLGSLAQGQLASFRNEQEVAQASARRLASVSQRVAEDSPAMMAAASNPFLSVFKLPSLLAEATSKNAAHRKRMEELKVAAAAGSESSGQAPVAAASSEGASRGVVEPSKATMTEDFEPLLRRWCDATGIGLPATAMLSDLRWDVSGSVSTAVPGRPAAGSLGSVNSDSGGAQGKPSAAGLEVATGRRGKGGRRDGGAGASASQGPGGAQGAQANRPTKAEAESLDDLLSKMGPTGK